MVILFPPSTAIKLYSKLGMYSMIRRFFCLHNFKKILPSRICFINFSVAQIIRLSTSFFIFSVFPIDIGLAKCIAGSSNKSDHSTFRMAF